MDRENHGQENWDSYAGKPLWEKPGVSSGLLKILNTSPIEVVQGWASIWAICLSAAKPHFSSTIGGLLHHIFKAAVTSLTAF